MTDANSMRCWKCHNFFRSKKAGDYCPHCGAWNIFNRAYQRSFRKKGDTSQRSQTER